MKLAFIATRDLGNDTFLRRVSELISKSSVLSDIELGVFGISGQEYQKYQWPIHKYTSILRVGISARSKLLKSIKEFDPDVLLFSGWEIPVGFSDLIKKMPSILCSDTTLRCSLELSRLASGYQGKLKVMQSDVRVAITQGLIYKRTVARIGYFLPMSSWCAGHLINDFHIRKSRVTVLPPVLDTKFWCTKVERNYNKSRRLKLLFVGNDWHRKGGDLLLQACATLLEDKCELTIISNDPALKAVTLPKGVSLQSGLTQNAPENIRSVYERHDVLVLPTRKDWSSHVIVEAASMGLPSIATDIGGIADLFEDRVTGYLMPLQANAEDWRRVIGHLADYPEVLKLMSKHVREFAQNKLSYEVGENILANAINSAVSEFGKGTLIRC